MRLLVPTLSVALAFALACGGGGTSTSTPSPSTSGTSTTEAPAPPPPPPPPAPPAAPVVTPVAAAPVAPAAPTPFVCCDNDKATAVVTAYLKLGAAFAKDDYRQAGGELSALQGQADSAKAKGGMDAESNTLLTTIRTETHNALLTQDVKERRNLLKKVSAAMIPFARKHAGGTKSVYEAWCPMAEAGWLQEGAAINNPYYGAEMLTCGSLK